VERFNRIGSQKTEIIKNAQILTKPVQSTYFDDSESNGVDFMQIRSLVHALHAFDVCKPEHQSDVREGRGGGGVDEKRSNLLQM